MIEEIRLDQEKQLLFVRVLEEEDEMTVPVQEFLLSPEQREDGKVICIGTEQFLLQERLSR